jgi:hypothetical protein
VTVGETGQIIRRYRRALVDIRTSCPDDVRGHEVSEHVDVTAPSGATKTVPMPNVPLAHSASRVVGGSGKRRRSYLVTRRAERKVYDADGIRWTSRQLQRKADQMLTISASYDLTSPSGRMIEAIRGRDDNKGRATYRRPTLIGTDMGISWEQVIAPGEGADPATGARVAEHHESQQSAARRIFGLSAREFRVGCDGTHNAVRLGSFAREVPTMPARHAVTARAYVARRGELVDPVTAPNLYPTHAVAVREVLELAPDRHMSGDIIGTVAMPATLTIVPINNHAEDGRMFVGNSASLPRAEPRGKNTKRDEARLEVRTARALSETVPYEAECSDALDQCAELVTLFGKGKETFAINGTTVRISVGGSGMASVSISQGDKRITFKARTGRAIARRLATMTH